MKISLADNPSASMLAVHSVEKDDIVQLSHVDGATIYIHSLKKDSSFSEMLSKINEQSSYPKATEIQEGDVVLVEYSGDFTRAEVMKVDSLTVKLIDFGKVIDVREVWEIPDSIMKYERMVVSLTLDLPDNLTIEESTAVQSYLQKLLHNRFRIVTKTTGDKITPQHVEDLINIRNGESTVNVLKGLIEKRFLHVSHKHVTGSSFCIVENKNVGHGFISCIMRDDRPNFVSLCSKLNAFGDTILHSGAYLPSKSEFCLVYIPDNDGTPMWYRCQYQQPLANDLCQVGLIDFGTSAIAKMADIRKMTQFDDECMTFTCKIRNDNISIDLLNQGLFGMFSEIETLKIRKHGQIYDIFIADSYFHLDDNIEEEELAVLDFLNG